jgi:hypothetical protein
MTAANVSATLTGIISTATTPASSRESSLRADVADPAPIHPQAKITPTQARIDSFA